MAKIYDEVLNRRFLALYIAAFFQNFVALTALS